MGDSIKGRDPGDNNVKGHTDYRIETIDSLEGLFKTKEHSGSKDYINQTSSVDLAIGMTV